MFNHKKNLVIVTDNFLPRRDGVVSFLTEIIPRLKSQFHITVICPDSKERVSMSGVKFVRIVGGTGKTVTFTGEDVSGANLGLTIIRKSK